MLNEAALRRAITKLEDNHNGTMEDDSRQVISDYLSALKPGDEIGDMVLVPKEPTAAMLRECQGDRENHPVLKYTTPQEKGGSIPLMPVAFYRAMLAATKEKP